MGTDDINDGARILGLSRKLAAIHATGMGLLFLVVISTTVWMSAEHNALARVASEELVNSGIASVRTRLGSFVRDYSIWDDAYDSLQVDDREWLYDNIGNAATEIGTLDLIEFVYPPIGEPFGWRVGSPREGETNLLPRDLLNKILRELDGPQYDDDQPGTVFADWNGEPWIFALGLVRPVDGLPSGVGPETMPRQIHGRRLNDQRLSDIGMELLIDDIHLASGPEAAGDASLALVGSSGDTVARISWTPPRPGVSILRRVAPPLALALAVVAVIGLISSRYAVRAASRLEEALTAAKIADRSKTEFLSNVSHELRTPMNGILGVAQLLRTTRLDSEQRELLEILFSSANTQMSLISDLLDLSRIENGNRTLTSAPFEPALILRDVAEMIRVAAAKKGIAFDADCGEIEGVVLRGDGRAFRQIVTNLLGNAVKFTDSGGVSLHARVTREGDTSRLTVSFTDTGRGIPAESLPRIFERFYQVDGSATRSAEGTGLGLAISQSLARMMGGRIEVESTFGVGSTFTFAAPFAVSPMAESDLDAA